MLFERTALLKKLDALARQGVEALRASDQFTPDLIFQDHYLLGFLGLTDTYSEKDLEGATLRELERFLLEFGDGFAFIARQRRITTDRENYYIDLLFYHRGLRVSSSDRAPLRTWTKLPPPPRRDSMSEASLVVPLAHTLMG